MKLINTIAAVTFDPAGFIELPVTPGTTIGETARRMNRVATLDGGAAVNDYGFSEADRTLDLRWRPVDRAADENVRRLVETYASLHVGTAAGVFLVAPESYRPGADESSLRLLVLARVSI